MNALKDTVTVLDMNNNESLVRGVFKESDGSGYTAMTFTQSKSFKTESGARKWLEKRTAK